MLKKLLNLYRTLGVMEQVEDQIHTMFALSGELFEASAQALLSQNEVKFDLYARDREINNAVVIVRRLLAEHLSVSRPESTGGALVFLKVITDLERVGDYAKNQLDLAKNLPKPISKNHYLETLSELFPVIKDFFPKAEKALFDGIEQDAIDVINGHHLVNRTYKNLIEQLLRETQLSNSDAVALALSARYFKRTSSHLKNVASTAVNPFPHIGFMPKSAQETKDE